MFNTKGWFNGVTKGHFSHCACPSLPAPPHHPILHPCAPIPRPRASSSGPLGGVGGHCGGGDFAPWHSRKPTILHFQMVNHHKKGNASLGFCLKTLYTCICIYVCVCMDICMYMHMYMYVCICPSQYKYSIRESCKYSLVTCLSASWCHIFSVTLTTPCTDWWSCV